MKKNLIIEDWRKCRQLLKVRIAPMMFLTNVYLLLIVPGCCTMSEIIFPIALPGKPHASATDKQQA